MSIEVEVVIAISVMMAVFSAVAAAGTAIVLGAGFARLHRGFEIIHRQSELFGDAIYRLEEKMDIVDTQSEKLSRYIYIIEDSDFAHYLPAATAKDIVSYN